MTMTQYSDSSTSTQPPDEPCAGCGSCVSRRQFFKTGIQAAALAAVASAFPGSAGAAPIRWIDARRAGPLLHYSVPDGDGVEVDRDNEVILARSGASVMAFALSCPHQRSLLRWREGDQKFQCTKHHSEYSPTGVYRKGRATRNMDRLAIRLEGEEIVVDPSTVYLSDEDPQGWASALVTLP